MRPGACSLLAGLLMALAAAPATASEIDSVFHAQDLQSNLITLDPVSGAASMLGGSGLHLSAVGLAGGSNGLYEVDDVSNLYSINPNTGAAALAGATGLLPDYGYWDTSLSDHGTNLYFTAGVAGAKDELYRINPTTGVAIDPDSTGVTEIAGSAIVNSELFQYHWDGSTDHIDSPVATNSAAGQSPAAPEPFSFLLLGSALIGLALWGQSRTRRKSGR